MTYRKLLTNSNLMISQSAVELTKPSDNHNTINDSSKQQSQLSINETVQRSETDELELAQISLVEQLEKIKFVSDSEWQTYLGKAIAQNYQHILNQATGELIDCDQLTELCLTQTSQIEKNELQDDLSDSLVRFPRKRLDLGSNTSQFLQKSKLLAYKEVRLPGETDRRLIIRTGECSGQFVLQVSQRLTVQSHGHDPDHIQTIVDKMNQVLAPTKQKIAQEESHILMWLLVWLSLSFAGVFLTTYYLHVWYAAIFVALLIGGSVYFCRRFQMTQNEDTQIKSHFALAMACRALNHQQRRLA